MTELQYRLPKAFFTLELPELRVVIHADHHKTVVFDPERRLQEPGNRELLLQFQRHVGLVLIDKPLVNLP